MSIAGKTEEELQQIIDEQTKKLREMDARTDQFERDLEAKRKELDSTVSKLLEQIQVEANPMMNPMTNMMMMMNPMTMHPMLNHMMMNPTMHPMLNHMMMNPTMMMPQGMASPGMMSPDTMAQAMAANSTMMNSTMMNPTMNPTMMHPQGMASPGMMSPDAMAQAMAANPTMMNPTMMNPTMMNPMTSSATTMPQGMASPGVMSPDAMAQAMAANPGMVGISSMTQGASMRTPPTTPTGEATSTTMPTTPGLESSVPNSPPSAPGEEQEIGDGSVQDAKPSAPQGSNVVPIGSLNTWRDDTDGLAEVQRIRKERNRLARETAETTDMASARSLQAEEASMKTMRVETSVDLCILMDCTGSMRSWIQAAKEQIKKTVLEAQSKFNLPLRTAFVGYRDFSDAKRFEICDFKSEDKLDEVTQAIADSTATGGGDEAEDVAGGLEKCYHLSWQSRTRIIVHIADAPAHGKEYHLDTVGDNHDGPQDPDPARLMRQLGVEKRVNYYFIKCKDTTDKMISQFREAHAPSGKEFQEIALGSDVSMFANTVLSSISSSIRNTGIIIAVHSGPTMAVVEDF